MNGFRFVDNVENRDFLRNLLEAIYDGKRRSETYDFRD